MNRYLKLYRDNMKRLHKMETIVEEVYIIVKEPETLEDMDIWSDWYETSSEWGQWSDIDYIYEPLSVPPPIRLNAIR